MFYNPPVVNKALGIRRSYINESARVAQEFLKHEMQTMVFANARLQTEVLLTYLQQANPQPPGKPETIRGYRGGYLPTERREIERGLAFGIESWRIAAKNSRRHTTFPDHESVALRARALWPAELIRP